MALQLSKDFNGIILPAAYVRVDRIFGGKKEGWNSVVGVYASAEAAKENAPLETFNQAAEYVSGENPYISLYAALKSREDMAGAMAA